MHGEFRASKGRKAGFCWIFALLLFPVMSRAADSYTLSTFSADVTIPMGHACMGGGIEPAQRVVDPLLAKGLVIDDGGQPYVLLAIDWCEIRNDAYERWREVLADAANSTPERVLVASVHQHDAPVMDLEAQRMLSAEGLDNALCDPEFHEQSVQKVAQALRESLENPQEITHYGIGYARVEKVTSNRRWMSAFGEVAYSRSSSTGDPNIRDAPPGPIDEWLRTLSFWNGEEAVAAVSAYSVHPMSYYGKGGVSYDFVGMAREQRQAEDPSVFQMYFTGCSGDTTAGKYNDGSPENRPMLAGRLYDAMVEAWEGTERHPLEGIAFRKSELMLEPRESPGYTLENMQEILKDGSEDTFRRNLAAMGLSWRKRLDAGKPIDVPAIDFGKAIFLLMPAESFVEFQLYAQELTPDQLVITAGFGECAPGYITTTTASRHGYNYHDVWCWVEPFQEKAVHRAIAEALLGSAE